MLLGTQMVAKGHHFEGVALAAVVDADTGMALPDFRAEERTFQLVTQLAGRSGRDAPGRVLVQTYQPDSRPISLAARHAVDEFLAGEIDRRRELGYPPFRHLVRIVVSGVGVNGPSALLTELRAGLEGADGRPARARPRSSAFETGAGRSSSSRRRIRGRWPRAQLGSSLRRLRRCGGKG